MATAPVFVGTPKLGLANLENADSTNYATILTAGASGSKVVSAHATSDDTSDRIITLAIERSAVTYILSSTNVLDLSGTNNTDPSVNLLASAQVPGMAVDNDGQRYLFLQSGDILKCKSNGAVTAAKVVNVIVVYGDF
jgi:hypothetical protein